MRVALIALIPLQYDGRRLESGAAFSATVPDAKVLTLLKKARLANGDAPEMPKTRRSYRRRDLVAED